MSWMLSTLQREWGRSVIVHAAQGARARGAGPQRASAQQVRLSGAPDLSKNPFPFLQPSAFLAVARGHIWPTCGSHYRSQGLRTAIFIHRMAGGGCLLRTPAPPNAGEMAGSRGPGGFGDLPAGRIPESSCAPGEGPGRPALQPRPLPIGLTALSEGLIGMQRRTRTPRSSSGTLGYTGGNSALASRSGSRGLVCMCVCRDRGDLYPGVSR